jgi:peptidoglycan/LPS O-acetylase OafA/YrhL
MVFVDDKTKHSHYLPTLDGWRAVAILLVLLEHGSESIASASGNAVFYKFKAAQCGLLGVHVFFGISGFLITSLFLDEERRNGMINLKSFYVRRFFRIMPAAILLLLLAGVLALWGIIPVNAVQWFSALFFFANYTPGPHSWFVGHFWSLAVEEHFYFLWPMAFLALATIRRRAAAAITVALLIALWRLLDFKYDITPNLYGYRLEHTDMQGDGLLWGAALALLNADEKWRPRLHRCLSSWIVWVLPIFLICKYAGVFGGIERRLLAVEAVAIPLMLLATVVHQQGTTSKILESTPLRYLGKLSYSIYLWQQLFLCPDRWRSAELGSLQTFPLNLLFAFTLAALSYYIVERPFRTFGHQIARHVGLRQKITAPLSLSS